MEQAALAVILTDHPTSVKNQRFLTASPSGRSLWEYRIGALDMSSTHNKKLTANAKDLRKNMTKEERHLWYDFLRDLPVMVHRQKVIGNYIVDFYIAEAKLVIELDGSQHFDADGQAYDAARDAFLQAQGLTVLRIPNNAVSENFRGVCEHIYQLLSPHQSKIKDF